MTVKRSSYRAIAYAASAIAAGVRCLALVFLPGFHAVQAPRLAVLAQPHLSKPFHPQAGATKHIIPQLRWEIKNQTPVRIHQPWAPSLSGAASGELWVSNDRIHPCGEGVLCKEGTGGQRHSEPLSAGDNCSNQNEGTGGDSGTVAQWHTGASTVRNSPSSEIVQGSIGPVMSHSARAAPRVSDEYACVTPNMNPLTLWENCDRMVRVCCTCLD